MNKCVLIVNCERLCRFSLLLLEPGEIYFQDFSVTFKSDADGVEQRGRLRLCSKSITFEPIDIKHPIIRINFIACTSIFQEYIKFIHIFFFNVVGALNRSDNWLHVIFQV